MRCRASAVAVAPASTKTWGWMPCGTQAAKKSKDDLKPLLDALLAAKKAYQDANGGVAYVNVAGQGKPASKSPVVQPPAVPSLARHSPR